MANDVYNFRVYSIRTPKFMERKDIEIKDDKIVKSHFEYSVLEHFFNGIVKIDDSYKEFEVNINHIKENCQITFMDFKNINNDFSCFTLETDRFGNERTIKDNKNKNRDKTLKSHESVPELIKLYIQKKHGLLFVSKDYNTILNKTTLNTFFNRFRFVLWEYIKEFNKLNTDSNYKIYRQPAIKVDSLPSMDFFNELDTLRSVKKFSYSYDPTGSDDTPNFLDISELDEAGFKTEELKVTRIFEGLKNNSDLKKIKKLYENLEKSMNFDDYFVEGVSNTGKVKVVKPEFSTKSINISFHSSEEIDDDKVVERINNYLITENVFLGKVFDLPEIVEPDFEFNDSMIVEINKIFSDNYTNTEVTDNEDTQ